MNDIEAEKNATYEYTDKVLLTIFRALKILNKNSIVIQNNSNSNQDVSSSNIKNEFVKLPKLEIPKFAGDCTNYTSFWNNFKCAIHENNDLLKIENFNYLKSCLLFTNPVTFLDLKKLHDDMEINVQSWTKKNSPLVVIPTRTIVEK